MKDPRYLEYRAYLKEISAGLASSNGYDKIESRIKSVTDWEEYRAISAQINVTLWFKNKNILKEIEPELPHRVGFADILLAFSNHDIYCEVTSLVSFFKPIESKKQDADNEKIEIKLQKQPYFTRQDIEYDIKKEKILRSLKEKTLKQLPSSHPGILALETGRAMVFHLEVKEIAKKLFKNKPQLILIMLWSLERGSDIGEPPFWFVNNKSKYQDIGKDLLKYLKQDDAVIS